LDTDFADITDFSVFSRKIHLLRVVRVRKGFLKQKPATEKFRGW